MMKKDRLPKDILERTSEIVANFSVNDKIIFAYLFGSLAKGMLNPLSDVDIAVYLDKCEDARQVKLDILGDLIKILSTDEIDLVVLNTASLPLKARVIIQGEILVDKEPFLRHKFESFSLRNYFDFQIKETAIFNRRYRLG